jgi:hypothetical protein
MALPKFTYHGLLPEGIHDCRLEEMEEMLVTNPQREVLWKRLKLFIEWAQSTDRFSCAYIDGGFITNKIFPEDIDVILQTRVSYGPHAFLPWSRFSRRASTRFSRNTRSTSTSGAKVSRAE